MSSLFTTRSLQANSAFTTRHLKDDSIVANTIITGDGQRVNVNDLLKGSDGYVTKDQMKKITNELQKNIQTNTKNIKANSGRSVIAAAAYQAAAKLHDEKLGMTFQYRHKEEVVYSEILLPPHAPAAFGDRETLWNAVEKKENKDNKANKVNKNLQAKICK